MEKATQKSALNNYKMVASRHFVYGLRQMMAIIIRNRALYNNVEICFECGYDYIMKVEISQLL